MGRYLARAEFQRDLVDDFSEWRALLRRGGGRFE